MNTTGKFCVFRSQFRECLQPHWQNLSSLLLHSDLEVAMVVVNILNYVPIPTALSSGAVVHVCGALVALFFRVLELEGIFEKLFSIFTISLPLIQYYFI